MYVLRSKIPSLMAKRQLESNEIITQTMISEQTKIPQPTLSRLIKGDIKRIEVENLVKLCEFFRCSIDDLFEVVRVENGDQTPSPDE